MGFSIFRLTKGLPTNAWKKKKKNFKKNWLTSSLSHKGHKGNGQETFPETLAPTDTANTFIEFWSTESWSKKTVKWNGKVSIHARYPCIKWLERKSLSYEITIFKKKKKKKIILTIRVSKTLKTSKTKS